MNMIQLRVAGLIGFCLLAAPLPSFAQTSNKPADTPVGHQAKATAATAPAPSTQDVAIPADRAQDNARQEAMSVSKGLSALWLEDPAFALDSAQAGPEQQTKPNSSNEPSLQGLGFPPSEIQGSAKEQALLDKRSHMLQIHQKLGLLTTIPLVAAVITGPGAKGHHGLPGSPSGREWHAALGGVAAGMYFTSAYFAIRAPKIPGTEPRGLIRLHKALAWIHGPGMIITPILGAIAYSQLSRGERVHGIARYHSVAAYTTLFAYGGAILSVTLK